MIKIPNLIKVRKSSIKCKSSNNNNICVTSLSVSSPDFPGRLDQKNPLQSGSSNIYGKIRVNNLTQFKTEKMEKRKLKMSIK